MRVFQLLTTMSYGDAVGNDTLAFDRALRNHGYITGIYAENIDKRMDSGIVHHVSKIPKLKKDDVVIYHFSTGTDLNEKIAELPCKVIMRYHNITPSHFFDDYSESTAELCRCGREQLIAMSKSVDYCLADSEYNKNDLREIGFNCKIDVLPILIPFSDYEKNQDETILRRYGNDEYINILFTGRIAPNKKQEDVIAAFYMYQRYYNEKSRLFLVGNQNGLERYYYRLKDYCKQLGVENVFFTGHIRFDEILAYYGIADVFLCQSEHEGFCVPLVEAMKFNIPIVAYDSSAVGETLGDAGLLLKSKDPLETAGVIEYVVKHPEIQKQLHINGESRLSDFEHDKIENRLISLVADFIGGK